MSTDQLELLRPPLTPIVRPGTAASVVVGRTGDGSVVITADSIGDAVGVMRQRGCPCSKEALGRAIRDGTQYLGCRWTREARPTVREVRR